MTLHQQLLALAWAMLGFLAVVRVVRVRRGRSPHPDGLARPLSIVAFVLVPPLALEIATNPQGQAGQLHFVESILVYVGGLLVGILAMAIAGLVAFWIARGRTRQTLLIALVGHDGGPGEVSFDPRMTPRLSECVAQVDRRNAVFPRGPEFPMQVDRSGFREDWDSLDDATRALEDEISTEVKLGQGVSYLASSTAKDARERLESLRRIAVDDGRAWAPA